MCVCVWGGGGGGAVRACVLACLRACVRACVRLSVCLSVCLCLWSCCFFNVRRLKKKKKKKSDLKTKRKKERTKSFSIQSHLSRWQLGEPTIRPSVCEPSVHCIYLSMTSTFQSTRIITSVNVTSCSLTQFFCSCPGSILLEDVVVYDQAHTFRKWIQSGMCEKNRDQKGGEKKMQFGKQRQTDKRMVQHTTKGLRENDRQTDRQAWGMWHVDIASNKNAHLNWNIKD